MGGRWEERPRGLGGEGGGLAGRLYVRLNRDRSTVIIYSSGTAKFQTLNLQSFGRSICTFEVSGAQFAKFRALNLHLSGAPPTPHSQGVLYGTPSGTQPILQSHMHLEPIAGSSYSDVLMCAEVGPRSASLLERGPQALAN